MLLLNKKEKMKHIGTVTLDTERFILRQFRLSDAHEVYENWSSDYEAAKYNAWSVHENEKVTESYVTEWVESYKSKKSYHWAVVDKVSEEVIGSISVSNIKNRKRYCEIGYTVAKKRWNEGIATEILKEVLSFLINEVGFDIVCALHDIRNIASGKVMEKVGMIYVKNKICFFLSGMNFFMNCRVYEYRRGAL